MERVTIIEVDLIDLQNTTDLLSNQNMYRYRHEIKNLFDYFLIEIL